jgi:hypothetical protein
MSKKLDAAIRLAQVHYTVVQFCGHDMETDVFAFIQENWVKGHKLFEILEQEKYAEYVPFVMENFTLKQINNFFEELDILFRVFVKHS